MKATMAPDEVPVIDISSPEDVVARHIRHACTSVGFFYGAPGGLGGGERQCAQLAYANVGSVRGHRSSGSHQRLAVRAVHVRLQSACNPTHPSPHPLHGGREGADAYVPRCTQIRSVPCTPFTSAAQPAWLVDSICSGTPSAHGGTATPRPPRLR